MNSLPKTVTRQSRGCDLNPGRSAPESSTLTTRLPSQPCSTDCETVGIPPLMSRKTLGILDGGRGGAVDRSWRRRGIRGVDKGGA